nr:hypothetical protein [Gammaproteobacteria bacterium]
MTQPEHGPTTLNKGKGKGSHFYGSGREMGLSQSYLLAYVPLGGRLSRGGPGVCLLWNVRISMLSEGRVFPFNVSPRLPIGPPLNRPRRYAPCALISGGSRWSRQHRSPALLVVLLALLSGCAFLDPKSPAPGDVALDTVRKIQFTGNEAFRSSTLLEAMSTQPRSSWQFWSRGDPY